jgi:hypothetical protein
MATLTGLYISQSYGGVIHLSTNTGITTGSATQLQDGLGTNLGVWFNGQGNVSASTFTGLASNATSASYATFAATATSSSFASQAANASTASYALFAITASYALNVPTNTASASYLSGSTAIVNNDITIVGGYLSNPMTIGFGKAGAGDNNIAIGGGALANVASGDNMAIGKNAGLNISGSTLNIAIGNTALRDMSANGSNNNLVIGHNSFDTLTAGIANVAIGHTIGISATSGIVEYNTIVGDTAGRDLVNGRYNVGLGYRSLYGLQSGSRNIGIGWETIVPGTAESNVAIGTQAGKNFEGNNNIALGDRAGLDITTGNTNTILGANTGRGITTGTSNTIVGSQVTGLSSGLSNNIILADGDGNIRARYSGSWTMSGIVNTTASFAQTASYALAGDFVALNTNNTYTGNQIYSGSASFRVIPVSIASSTASLNLSSGSFFTIDLSGGNTHITAVSASRGQSAVLQLTQPFAGNATVTFNSMFSFPTGSAFSTSLSSSAVDILSLVSFNGTNLRSLGANNYIPV